MTNDGEFDWDAFICHAWEDKDVFVRHLALGLIEAGHRVWYDEFALVVGDSLRQKVEEGLKRSRYGVVVLSPRFFAKEWPQRELDVLLQRDKRHQKVVLPIWLDLGYEEVFSASPLLAGRVALLASAGVPMIVRRLGERLRC